MVTQTTTQLHRPTEAAVTSTSELNINHLIIQKALVRTAKAFGVGGVESKQSASHQPNKQGAHLKLPS